MPTHNKGAALNKRVWSLFERAGFTTKPNSNDPSEYKIRLSTSKVRTPDLFAEEEQLGIRIIGWNKSRKEISESLTVHIHDYEQLRKIEKADSVLFVSTEKEFPTEDKKYALEKGMRVWGNEELNYYETVVDAIGTFAKYEIINSFGLKTKESKYIQNTIAIQISQPQKDSEAQLFLFSLPAQAMLRTCSIFRKAQGDKDAYQRILRKNRLNSIYKFITKNDAILPPNIIVFLHDNITFDEVEIPKVDFSGNAITFTYQDKFKIANLKIPLEYGSMEIIDGQHRLFGFVNTENATRQEFNLVVLGIKNIDPNKKRDTFIAINDNSRRMDPNLVAFLKFTEDEGECQNDNELMAIKIVVELNKTTPFKNRIKILDIGKQKITLKGFAGYDLRGLTSKNGLLRKYYGNSSTEHISLLRTYFSLLKSAFPKQWIDDDKFIIFTNRGISAFLKLLKSILKTEKSRIDSNTIKKYLNPLRKWKNKDWQISNLKGKYVGGEGWRLFHKDLVDTIRKQYPNFKQ